MVWSLVIALYTVMVYISKTSNYLQNDSIIYKLDYDMFLALINWNIGYYTLMRVSNWSVVIYMFSMLMFVTYYFENRYMRIEKHSIVKIVYLCFLLMFYIWFYDPSTSYFLYTKINGIANSKTAHIFKFMVYSVDFINYVWVIGYFCLSFYIIGQSYKKNLIIHKKKQAIAVAVCLFVLNLVYVVIFVFGTFRQIYFFGGDLAMLSFGISRSVPQSLYRQIPFLLLIALCIMVFVVVKYNVTSTVGVLSQRHLQNSMKGINKNYLNVFHSFKNVIFSFIVMVRRAQTETSEKQLDTMREIEKLMNNYIEELSKMLELNNKIDIAVEECNIIRILEDVITYLDFQDDIKIKRIYEESDIMVIADSYFIRDAFANIVQNGIEAIKQSKRKGIITLEVRAEYEWVIIRIGDNGIGIKPKDIKHIFKNFYTTKSRMNNWGIGLSFVFKIIKMHMGYISLESKYDVGTTFQVLLPRA